MKEYKISNKQWLRPLFWSALFLSFLGIVLLSINGWNSHNIKVIIVLIVSMLFIHMLIITQNNWIISLNFDDKYIYIRKLSFFRIHVKKYKLDEIKCSYKKKFYGRMGKTECFIIEEKFQRKEIIPAPFVGYELLNKFVNELEMEGIFVDKENN